MKLLLSLMITGTALFAGGDILPVNVVTVFEKPIVKPAPTKCYKPNIKKCPDCEDVAELCPDDPSLPIAKTEVCEGLLRQQAGH
jgi:hypothetical protein